MIERKARQPIATRIEPEAFRLIEHEAEVRRTTPSHVARILLEDAARELAEHSGRAAA